MSEAKPEQNVEEGLPEQATASAVHIPESTMTTPPNISIRSQEKEGGKCCGCCCDYRRAVVVVAIIFIVFAIASLLGALLQIPGIAVGVEDEEVARTSHVCLSCVGLSFYFGGIIA